MSNYLRNRPFLIISYSYVLADDQKSNTPGFGLNAEWAPIESMVISDRVSSKQLRSSELIIDIFEHKVIKCRDTSIDHDQIFVSVIKRYMHDIKEALKTWVSKDPTNLQKVQVFVEKFSTKEEPSAE